MVRDMQLRLLFIPLLGMLIPVASGIIAYEKYSSFEIIAANLFFIFTSFVIWAGCNLIHMKLRPMFGNYKNPFFKITSILLVSALYGAVSGGFLTMMWFSVSKEIFSSEKFMWFVALTTAAILVFTLVYEILFLSKERELDTKIVDELDRERKQAEMAVLQNELDPHFIFNSLNTLNHLIINSPNMAHLFNVRLAQVYKYFLTNKSRELVSLYNEMEFIENYFFLLHVRHENKLQLETGINEAIQRKVLMPPCSLQMLVENALKHNEFSEDNPLKIKISMNGQYLKVSNNTRPKPYLADSTKIGLKNLSSRYKLICNRDIVIENSETAFLVKLPLISSQ
jgi:sensor histidine kinase YesM